MFFSLLGDLESKDFSVKFAVSWYTKGVMNLSPFPVLGQTRVLTLMPPTYINSKHTAMEVQLSVITVGRFCMDCYTKDSSVMHVT